MSEEEVDPLVILEPISRKECLPGSAFALTIQSPEIKKVTKDIRMSTLHLFRCSIWSSSSRVLGIDVHFKICLNSLVGAAAEQRGLVAEAFSVICFMERENCSHLSFFYDLDCNCCLNEAVNFDAPAAKCTGEVADKIWSPCNFWVQDSILGSLDMPNTGEFSLSFAEHHMKPKT